MKKLELFITKLCGKFNNDEQIKEEIKTNNISHPKALHINGICNDKIVNLPKDFEGYFIIEESYYEQGNFKNTLPHLFLFTLTENNEIMLTSYEIPKHISKEDFKNDNLNLILNYDELEISKKFTPMVYKEKGEAFIGESISHFTPDTTFKLKETIENDIMYVSEVFEKNGKITFGFVDPIIYKKII